MATAQASRKVREPRFRVTDGDEVLNESLNAADDAHARSLVVYYHGCDVGERCEITEVKKEKV